MNRIYLAGPISGRSYDEVIDYYNTTITKLKEAGFNPISPMLGKQALRTELEFKASGYTDVPVATNHAIYSRDQWMVRQSDIVYANLTESGSRVSIGTMMELAWAQILGKHVIVAMQVDNIHRHAFVLEAAGTVFNSHEDAMNYLLTLKSS